MSDDPTGSAATVPVVRLRRDADGDDDSIFRYDRPALLAAVARSTGGR
jgi:two-component system chemotaxis sensor kinase CheA